MWNPRGVQQSSTRTIVTSPQFLDTGSRKTAAVEPSTELLTDKRCTTTQNRCLKRLDRESTHNVVRQNCVGEAHLHRYKSWKNSKFETLDSYGKFRRRNSATTQSTTRLCSSEKRMQTIAWRALGKSPTRTQRHSSQSTKKTAKNTTIWGQRRILLRGWPQNRLEVLQRVAEKPADNFVLVVNVGPKPSGGRAIGILSILQAVTIGTFFSELGQEKAAARVLPYYLFSLLFHLLVLLPHVFTVLTPWWLSVCSLSSFSLFLCVLVFPLWLPCPL